MIKWTCNFHVIGRFAARCSDAVKSGKMQWIDSNDYLVQQYYQQRFFAATENCKTVFLKAGSDLLHIRTDEDYVKVLKKFFIGRNRPA